MAVHVQIIKETKYGFHPTYRVRGTYEEYIIFTLFSFSYAHQLITEVGWGQVGFS